MSKLIGWASSNLTNIIILYVDNDKRYVCCCCCMSSNERASLNEKRRKKKFIYNCNNHNIIKVENKMSKMSTKNKEKKWNFFSLIVFHHWNILSWVQFIGVCVCVFYSVITIHYCFFLPVHLLFFIIHSGLIRIM